MWPASERRRHWIAGGKEEARKDQDGCGGINVEIEKLNGGADQAREKHLPWRV